MDRFARTVLGYHGCDPAFAEQVINGSIALDDWKPSANDYDWLGHGIYFWEYAPERALNWTNRSENPQGGVIGAIIQLGNCLDLTDLDGTKLLGKCYESVKREYESLAIELPVNRQGRNFLDCLVINRLNKRSSKDGFPFQTVRCPFLEGSEVYPGSMIRSESHVQLVVKDATSILGVFRPNLSIKGEIS
jgi:hypothetical protein